MIRFAHIIDDKNTGDLMSGPYRWFDFPAHEAFNYSAPVPDDGALTVFGGGTMVNWLTNQRPDDLPRGPKVVWGAGSSRHGEVDPWPDPSGFDLIGTREWTAEREAAGLWAPCPSCMSPLLDQDYEITRAKVAFVNASDGIRSRYPAVYGLDVPMMGNDRPMSEIIAFLGSAETVVTNSYHGLAWSSWLGRNIEVHGYSSKFHRFPYLIPVDECRAATRRFYERVRELA